MARPKKPATKTPERVPVTMTLPPALLKQIDALAKREERSRSKVIEMAMRKHVEEAAA